MWIARRLGLAILTLWLVSVLTFLATAALGDPVRAILGRDYNSNPGRVAELEALLGTDQSLVSRYFDWLGGLLTGDLGVSLATGGPVSELISDSVVNSAVLVLLSAVVMIPLAFGVAMISVHYRRKRPDTVIQTILLAMAGLPEFVIGVLLIALFATTVFTVLPAVTLVPMGGKPWDDPKSMVLPTLTLVLWVTPYVSRIVRASLLEVIDSDYVELARLKGIPEKVVMRKHALLNAIVPGIQVDRAPAGLPGRRRRGRGDAVLLPGDRPPARRRRAQPRRRDGAGAEHDHRQRLRRGEPHRGPPVHPVDPTREDGDLVMSAEAVTPPPAAEPPAIAPAEPSTFRKAMRQKRFVVGLDDHAARSWRS